MFYKGETPFVRLLIPLLAGIVFAYSFPSQIIADLWLCVAVFLLFLLFLFLFFYKKYKLYKTSWLAGSIIHACIFFTGAGLTVNNSNRFDPSYFAYGESDYFILKLTNEPVLSNGIFRFETEVLKSFKAKTIQERSGNLLVLCKPDKPFVLNLKYGDILMMPAKFSEVNAPFNPGEFDYKRYLSNRKIHYQAFLNGEQIKLLRRNAGNPVISYALKLRLNCVERINRSLADKDAAALASALILGYRSDLSTEIVNAYADTGTMHVLSVSGMHVGIVFLVLNVLLKPLSRNSRLIFLRSVLIIGFIWFYALLTGFSASVCRAAFMLSFVLIGKSLNRDLNTYNLIAISAFFLLLVDPWYLFDVGFQLSYLAVCGLIYFQPIIYNALYFENKIFDMVWSYSALSLAAQIATFPLSIYYFHQFPVYFLISNLLIVMPVAVIMYAGIAFILFPFTIVENVSGQFLNHLIIITNNVLFKVEALPSAVLSGLWINELELVLISLIIFSISLGCSFKIRYMLWQVLILILILSVSLSLKSIGNFKRNELVFMSLRKNSAIAWFNQGKVVVVSDINPSDKIFDYSLRPMIASIGGHENLFANFGQNISGHNFKMGMNFIQFGNFKLLRWNKDWNKCTFQSDIQFDAVLISNDAVWNLKDIMTRFQVKMILIDGTNSDYRIRKWLIEAKRLKIRSYSLKKNPAYIVKL